MRAAEGHAPPPPATFEHPRMAGEQRNVLMALLSPLAGRLFHRIASLCAVGLLASPARGSLRRHSA
jgi:hypothetical protein